MPSFQTTRRVAHSAEDMFALVAAVEHYPDFVPLCERLTVRSRERQGAREILVADMTVAYKVFRETFKSRVSLEPEASEILVTYLDGPFRHMENRWRFRDVGPNQSDVEFFISYELRSRSLRLLMGAMFDKAFRKFAAAFEQRADAVYGATRAVSPAS
ncbi:MAG: SRPBCC family protein [Hyphomicrobiales bacterium]|nr:SRPBCC family protein [Hyphomicrobiales bacterium]